MFFPIPKDVQTSADPEDAMTCRMVLEPQSLDTIVATNLVLSSSPVQVHRVLQALTTA
jgi:hypothetical protein